MKKYSITKYVRGNGTSREEWTSISDIGKMYNGIEFTLEDYKKVEDVYVSAILEIARYLKIESYKIKDIFRWKDLRDLIKYRDLYTDSMLNIYEDVTENSIINENNLKDLIRLELREDIGGLLYVPQRLKIFIGYDFMMGVHSSSDLGKVFNSIEKLGLHIYQFK